MEKKSQQEQQVQQPKQPIVPGVEKQVLLSVLLDFTVRCKQAIERSVKQHMDEHKDDPEALKDASLYMDGANMMYNLIMQGLLNAPQVHRQAQNPEEQQVQHANRQERRAAAKKQHKTTNDAEVQ